MPRSRIAWFISAFFVLAAVALGGFLYPRGAAAPAAPVLAPPAPGAVPSPAAFDAGSWPALQNADFFAETKAAFLAAKASFVEADLSAMTLRVYADGQVVKEVPILTKGREGSWWETPAGLYRIEAKLPNHFSGFGKVYMPWSLIFQGNFFIHGWPYYPDGTPVTSAYSGGCIRLSTDDAKAVYNLVQTGMPVLVYAQSFAKDSFTYSPQVIQPDISAPEYLAADLKNNFVFAGRNLETPVPIASLAKLMTALVAAEYINLDKPLTVPRSAIVYTSKPRLVPGEKITAYQLLYPLLQESSNEAAITLAAYLGPERFVELMNRKAMALGMQNTHFTDPAGRSPEDVSTPQDLFLLAKYLLNNRSFILKITSGKVEANAYGPAEFKDLENFNIFGGAPDFLGGKVGEIPAAGETMLALFSEKLSGADRPLAVLVLGSKNKAADILALKNAVLNAYP